MSKGLGALEKYKRGFVAKEYETIEKELKALEIIKSKLVDVMGFYVQFCTIKFIEYKDYEKNWSLFSNEKLTQQEYDLLKEVML